MAVLVHNGKILKNGTKIVVTTTTSSPAPTKSKAKTTKKSSN